MNILNRPRRNRKTDAIRRMVRENHLTTNDVIAPLFVIEGNNQKIPISSMPDCYRLSIDNLVKEAKELYQLGVPAISLFPAVAESLKTKDAREAYNPDGLNQRAVRAVKNAVPELAIMTDIALDPYSSDGHDGLVSDKGEILNDETLEVLQKMAVCQAKAGSDILGPSDMMDGRVLAIREAIEAENYKNVSIMAYTAKYASAFYGPFRDALDSAPKSGDKKTYQMDFANKREAIRELKLDEAEYADFVMVKPGIAYLDIVAEMRANTNLPIAVYNVSGEYAMVKAAAQNGWIDGQKIMLEMLYGFKRAGADVILTYFARELAEYLND